MSYNTQFIHQLKFHLKVCHFLECVRYEYDPISEKLVTLKNSKITKISNLQAILSMLYSCVLFLNLCFGPFGTRDKLQGAVFFLLVLVASVMRWNQGLEDNQSIQVINSFLHFERNRLKGKICEDICLKYASRPASQKYLSLKLLW